MSQKPPDYEATRQGDILIFHFREISGFARSNLRDAVRAEWDKPEWKDCRHVLVDCKDLTYANSLFLETILELRHHAEERLGQFAVSGVGGMVKNIIQVSNLDQLFPMYDTQDEALNHLASSKP